MTKTINIVLQNTGTLSLDNLNLKLDGLDRNWYNINPFFVSSLAPGEIVKFEADILLPDLIGVSEKTFNYSVNSQQFKLSRFGLLKIKSQKDFILNEIEASKLKINSFRDILLNLQNKNIDVSTIPELLQQAIEKINDAERDVKRDYNGGALTNLKQGNSYLNLIDIQLKTIGVSTSKEPDLTNYNKYILDLLGILIILIIIISLIKLYRKATIVKFLKNHEFKADNLNIEKPETKLEELEDSFMKKIREIENKLKR